MKDNQYQKQQRYWEGTLPNGPLVLYDSKMQSQVSGNMVNLFDCRAGKMKSYEKEATRRMVEFVTGENARQMAIRIYEKWLRDRKSPFERRSAYCWKCGRDLDSRLDKKCMKCGWIKCVCGGCGYEYEEGW